MEGIFMGKPLNQNNINNTADGGIPLESGIDVKRGRFDVEKLESYLKDGVSLQPVVDEDEDEDEDGGVLLSELSPTSSYGSLSICGRRRVMEDTLTISPRVMLSNQHTSQLMVLDFFALYDGHRGASAADVCRDRLHFLLFEEINEYLREGDEVDWKKVFGNSFVRMDEETDEERRIIGSTALVALVSSDQIIVGNCGESKAVLCRQGEVVPLSLEHMPERPDGVLPTSESIDQLSVPQVTVTERRENDEFLILATDGLWSVMTSEMACYVVGKCLQGGLERRVSSSVGETGATEAAAVLAELAMAKESEDNISIVVIELNKA